MTIRVGDIFKTNQGGSVTVVECKKMRSIVVQHNDNHKHLATVSASDLKKGKVKNPYFASLHNIGYLGFGCFSAAKDDSKTHEYITWDNMLRRCYSRELQLRQPAYKDCQVSCEWLNFQNFAKWFTENDYYNPDYELDKDLLVKGNKLYSPDTCCLIPKQLNRLLISSDTTNRKYPVGTSFHKAAGKFRAYLTTDNKTHHLGLFDTVAEAHQAYVTSKEAYVKLKATQWKGKIDERVFDALMNWRVAR